MTEEEEFEFRARLEAEQAAASSPAQGSTSVRGALSEINKGIGRGALSLPVAIGQGLEKGAPIGNEGDFIRPPAADANMATLRNTLMERLRANPNASQTEQMLGTGAELTAAALPFAGGPGTLPQRVMGLAAPVVGGVVGEQVGGEQGKAVGTLLAPAAQALAGRVLSPRLTPEMELLAREGVEFTPGQQTGGFLKKFENFPLVKEFASNAKQRGIESYNNAVLNVALKPLGIKVKDIGFKGFDKADRLASQAYDDILPQLKIKYDPRFSAEMAQQRANAPLAIRADLEDLFNREILGKLQKGSPVINPRVMKEMDTALGQEARAYMKDPAVQSQKMAQGIREMQGALREMVARQNPSLSKELQAVNATWNNLVRVENATVRAGNELGVFTPAQFQTSVKMMDSSLKKKAFATGGAAMQDISNAGMRVLGGDSAVNIPYAALRSTAAAGSGLALGAGIGASATGFGAPLAGAAAGLGALYSAPGQRLAQMALTGPRPPALRTLGEAFRGAPPGATLGASIPSLPFLTRPEEQ